jgi:AraC-like DNA-binding protein
MKLVIKNMVCARCVSAVQQLLEKHHIRPTNVQLGEVQLESEPSPAELKAFSEDLNAAGFEILDDQKKMQIERIKSLLISKVQSADIEDHFSLSKYLSENIFRDYSMLSKMFSEVEGITLEQFFILQKIEKAKELLVYNELPLSRIAVDLGYSSSQHLSTQFRKLTGMTPSAFRSMAAHHRKSLDKL